MQTSARATGAAGGDAGASAVEYSMMLVGVCTVLVLVAVGLRTVMSSTFTSAQGTIGKDQASLILNHVGALPPTGLTAKPGNAKIELNWDDMISSTSYTVTGCGATQVVTDSAAICTGLTNGTTYTVSVTASGPGGTSSPTTATATPMAPPVAPNAPIVTLLSNTTAKITWTAVPTATSYNVYGCGTSIYVVLDPVAGYTCPRPVGSDYSVTITAVNAGGESSPSAATTLRQAAPDAPTNLFATPGNRTIVLTWDPMPGATNYVVTGCASISPSANPTGTTATCNNLTNGTPVTVSVKSNGPGGTSTTASVVTATPVAPPSAPTNLRVVSSTTTTVTLGWNASASATSYNVYGCGSTDTAPTTTYLCTRPAVGNYTVTVTAVNAGGESPASNSVSVTPRPPSPPTNLVGTPGDRTIVLTWDAVPGATSYSVTGCGSSITPSANPSGTTATCNNLTNGTNYTVSVTANGPGGSSTATTVTVAVPWRVIHSNNNGLTVTWTNPPDTAVPNNYNLASCNDSLNSADISCNYSNGNLTMSTDRNTPLGTVTLTWRFTRNNRPDVIYTETFVIS